MKLVAAVAASIIVVAGSPAFATTTDPALQTVDMFDSGFARSAVAGTKPFSLVGATWTNPETTLAAAVEVRTRAADGRWSDWQRLESDEADAAEPGSESGGRGSTDPLWVGASDAVQARVIGTAPAGLRLDLINPDTQDRVLERAAATTPDRPNPKMITRAGWRANESIVKGVPEYTADVQVLFVHHTATSNNYSCGESASIIRGIQAYHIRSKGWNDIGYNFLVDKCGNLFEGRRGGVDKPVLGAHTLGFNAHSAAIAVIGNYQGIGAPLAVRTVIAQVAAWKLGTYGNLPTGKTVLVSNGSDRFPKGQAVSLNRISGHRDTGKTECPGDMLYSQLGTIRGVASAGPAGLGFLRMTGAVKAGSTYYTPGAVSPLWQLSTPTAMLSRFDVLADGDVQRSVPANNRTSALTLTPGTHLVSVRAVHLNGRTATATARVVADPVAPVFSTAPALALRTGSLSSSVPVRLGYAVHDAVALRQVALTSPAQINMGTTARSYPGTIALGKASTWTVRAMDWAGNIARAAVTRTPTIRTEAQAARTGMWRTLPHPAYLGGAAAISSTAGSTMAWTFTGVGAQLAVSRTPSSGRVRVYVDGVDAGVLDLHATIGVNRYAIWAPGWGTVGRHTIKVVVEGTAGRPNVIIDGLVGLQ